MSEQQKYDNANGAMGTNSLHDVLFKTLNNYPNINDFFGEMIRSRVKRENWLLNPLVLIILGKREVNLGLIDDMIRRINETSKELITLMKAELTGHENQFDRNMGDLLAELRAIIWIRDQGYNNIKKIEKRAIKTPDFRASKNGGACFEVKNLRLPITIIDHLFDKLEVMYLLNTKIFDQKQFIIGLAPDEVYGRQLTDADKSGIDQLLENIQISIDRGQQTAEHTYEIPDVESLKVTLRCNWKSSNVFSMIGPLRKNAINFSDSRFILSVLFPLIKKTWSSIGIALDQLYEYDLQDQYDKYVLINWQKPSHFAISDELENRYQEMIKRIDSAIKMVNAKTSIILM